MFTARNIFCLILLFWVVFSVVYIGNDIWSNYKKVQLVESYNQGKADVINYLVLEAEKCEAIPVFSGEKEIQLIGVDCP